MKEKLLYAKIFLVQLLALIILHLIALAKMNYGYYEFLRVATFLLSISFLVVGYLDDKEDFINAGSLFFIIIGILWNPIFPIHMSRTGWNILNGIVVVLSAAGFYEVYKVYKILK